MLNLRWTQSPATNKVIICINYDIQPRRWIEIMGDRDCSTISSSDLLGRWMTYMVLNCLFKLSGGLLIPIRRKTEVLLVFGICVL